MRHDVGEMRLTGCSRRFTVADRFGERGHIIRATRWVRAVGDWAVSWSPLAVHVAVSPQHGRAGEALSTGVADVGFLTSV